MINFYTHDIIYKNELANKEHKGYSFDLRQWIDRSPEERTKEIISYEDYLYSVVHGRNEE